MITQSLDNKVLQRPASISTDESRQFETSQKRLAVAMNTTKQ